MYLWKFKEKEPDIIFNSDKKIRLFSQNQFFKQRKMSNFYHHRNC